MQDEILSVIVPTIMCNGILFLLTYFGEILPSLFKISISEKISKLLFFRKISEKVSICAVVGAILSHLGTIVVLISFFLYKLSVIDKIPDICIPYISEVTFIIGIIFMIKMAIVIIIDDIEKIKFAGTETLLGNAFHRHACRNPDIWGKVKGGPKQINKAASLHADYIYKAKEDFIETTTIHKGKKSLKKILSDGRGIRLGDDKILRDFFEQKEGSNFRNIIIFFFDMEKNMLNRLLSERLITESSVIKTSHFYDKKSKKDLEFHEIDNINRVFSPKGNGNIFFDKLYLGMNLCDVVTIFSFNKKLGNVYFDFMEDQLTYSSANILRDQVKGLIEYLSILKEEFKIPTIAIGLEPIVGGEGLICKLEGNDIDLDLDTVIDKLLD